MPALRVGPTVARAFLRGLDLLEPPEALRADPRVLDRVMELSQSRDQRPPEPPNGPDRAMLLAAIS